MLSFVIKRLALPAGPTHKATTTAARAAVAQHAAPALACKLGRPVGAEARRGLMMMMMVQEPGMRERPVYDKDLAAQDKWGDPAKKAQAEAPGTKYPPRMEADMDEAETARARKAQRSGQGGEEEGEGEAAAAFQSDSKEEQHTTADPDTGGAGTGTGGDEAGGGSKGKEKGKGKGASGSPPISGHPGESGYVRREEGADYRPGA